MYNRLVSVYGAVAAWLIRRPVSAALLFLLFSAVALMLFWRWPTSFIPEEDQGYFVVSVQLPPASSLQRTEAVSVRVGELLAAYPEVVA